MRVIKYKDGSASVYIDHDRLEEIVREWVRRNRPDLARHDLSVMFYATDCLGRADVLCEKKPIVEDDDQ